MNISLKVVMAKKILGIETDSNFIFENVLDLCKKANRKLRALAPAPLN